MICAARRTTPLAGGINNNNNKKRVGADGYVTKGNAMRGNVMG